jgi:hypothetical protein
MYPQLPATDIVPDILLHTLSISSIISLVLTVTKNRNAIVRITSLIAQTERVILKSSRKYYRKAKINLFV